MDKVVYGQNGIGQNDMDKMVRTMYNEVIILCLCDNVIILGICKCYAY